MMDVKIAADLLLRISNERNIGLTGLQLVKLSYISYGFHMAIKEERLFNNRIEAWKFGPNIPDLYKVVKKFENETMEAPLLFENEERSPSLRDLLSGVLDSHGNLSEIALSSLAHAEGTPWHQARERKETLLRDEDILDYYKKALKREVYPYSGDSHGNGKSR